MPIETRLNKPIRGWFHDRNPSFHKLKEHLRNLTTKSEIKLAAKLYVYAQYGLSKLALLDDSTDVAKDIATYLKNNDFGYGTRTPRQRTFSFSRDERPLWSHGLSGIDNSNAGELTGANNNYQSTSV